MVPRWLFQDRSNVLVTAGVVLIMALCLPLPMPFPFALTVQFNTDNDSAQDSRSESAIRGRQRLRLQVYGVENKPQQDEMALALGLERSSREKVYGLCPLSLLFFRFSYQDRG